MLDGSDGNKIDCMFFPCTVGEKVVVDERQNIDGSDSDNYTSNEKMLISST